MRPLVPLTIVLVSLTLALAPAAGAEGADDELAGYVGTASGAAFSLQPVFPGLLPTGDAPFEVTTALTTANVKSGGNAYGQAAAVWPGSAAANLGPLLGTGANQPVFAQIIPPYPAAVTANQDDGEQAQGAAPGPVLRASGKHGAASSTATAGAADLPGILHADAVSSTSRAAVEGGALVTETVVSLAGVALGDGAVTIDSVRSLARATSKGDTSTSTGSTVLSGLRIAGHPAELTGEGLATAGVPVKVLADALKAAGIELTLTDGSGSSDGGAADRVSSGLTVTIANPAAGANPQFEGSKFVLTLGPTAVGALASPPFASDFNPDVPLPTLDQGSGFSTVATTVTDSFAGGGTSPGGSAVGGGPVAFEPARKVLEPVGGVPGGLLTALVAAVALGGRWISRFVGRFVSIEE
jgi:hypothetical protein